VIDPVVSSPMRVDYSGTPTVAGLVPVSDIMTREVVSLSADAPIGSVIDLVVNRYLGCVPIVDDDGCPIGMITKRDLVEPLKAGGSLDPTSVAKDLMLPLAFTLDERATVAQVSALMASEGLHHVPIVSAKGRLAGLVSSLDIVRWLVRNDGLVEGG
jgi:CBS domain-containing protein